MSNFYVKIKVKITVKIFILILMSNCSKNDGYKYYNYDDNYGYIETQNYNLWDEDAPEYQCELSVINHKTGTQGICSGTYLSPTVFLTAAHCIDTRDVGPVNNSTRSYKVNCHNKSFKNVKAIAIHPLNRVNNPTFEVIAEPNELNPERMIYDTYYNDLAVLLTEPIDLSSFPMLPDQDFHNVDTYKNGSCRILGYSPAHCNSITGKGCFREGFSSKLYTNLPDSELVETGELCELKTGNNCYISSFYNEYVDDLNPLLLSVGQISPGTESIGTGDSGSGLVCKDQINSDIVVGVLSHVDVRSLSERYIFVNIKNKLNFIQKFLSFNDSEFMENSQTYTINPDYLERLNLEEEIKTQLTDLSTTSYNTRPIEIELILIDKEANQIAKDFLDYLVFNSNAVKRFLSKEQNIILAFSKSDLVRSIFLNPILISRTPNMTLITISSDTDTSDFDSFFK